VAKRITAAQKQQALKDFRAVLDEKEPGRGRRFKGRRAEAFSARQYAKYQAEGGEEGTGQTFKEWLRDNWASILSQLLAILLPLLTKGAV
jgi:hypothetical protein